ncbi:MAG: T9SS type A sorting domain-containing protein [Bacteroidetes bacterium]|nr:T9SS type A sorting domain-containing protein [Bacteroidota bacterium]
MKALHLRFSLITFIFLAFLAISFADSGGPLKPEQAAYDVTYYYLDLSIDPETQTIDGSLLCQVTIINPIDTLLLDLDDVFSVSNVEMSINNSAFQQTTHSLQNEFLLIDIPEDVNTDDIISCKIYYNGEPKISQGPPWDAGFVWETTSGGQPWLGVACQFEGGDIWWPCKDHPSDEPDSMHISLTVPNPLVCVSNGQYLGFVDNGDNTSTYNWFVSVPINNYNVTFYAADFLLIEDDYQSTIGNDIPFRFWVLPEDYETAVDYMDVFHQEFDFLEEICGPFPFGTDKHGWAHAPYWGMEHQSIIAYGHDFTTNEWGYDYIHLHELAHEWWGNLLTAKNWADVWIHEGIATYTEALYVEHLSGMESYFDFMKDHQPFMGISPLAPYEEMTASDAFDFNDPYYRGASVMHTLRYHLGDDLFFELLKRWAYPDPDDLGNEDGRQCRLVNTEDLKIQAEEVTGVELDPFWSVFYREASFPQLKVNRQIGQTSFEWLTEQNVPLDLNVPITINGEAHTVEMENGYGLISMIIEDDLEIDPNEWILMQDPEIIVGINDLSNSEFENRLMQNYPNPFSENTVIEFYLKKSQHAKVRIYDQFGNILFTQTHKVRIKGKHQISFNKGELSAGVYYYQLISDEGIISKKLQIID